MGEPELLQAHWGLENALKHHSKRNSHCFVVLHLKRLSRVVLVGEGGEGDRSRFDNQVKGLNKYSFVKGLYLHLPAIVLHLESVFFSTILRNSMFG